MCRPTHARACPPISFCSEAFQLQCGLLSNVCFGSKRLKNGFGHQHPGCGAGVVFVFSKPSFSRPQPANIGDCRMEENSGFKSRLEISVSELIAQRRPEHYRPTPCLAKTLSDFAFVEFRILGISDWTQPWPPRILFGQADSYYYAAAGVASRATCRGSSRASIPTGSVSTLRHAAAIPFG